jgi:polyphosphate kinase
MKIFDQYTASTTAAWHLLPTGKWLQVDKDLNGEPLSDLQAMIIQAYRGKV